MLCYIVYVCIFLGGFYVFVHNVVIHSHIVRCIGRKQRMKEGVTSKKERKPTKQRERKKEKERKKKKA